MYEAVHADPDGDSTVARHAVTAARYGFDGVVVRAREASPDYERLRRVLGGDGRGDGDGGTADDGDVGADAGTDGGSAAGLPPGASVDLVDAVEVVADDPESAAGAVGARRPEHTLVLVRGGTPALNRFAVENDRVDVLTRPTAGDGDLNHVLATAAREHGVRVEFDLGPVLRAGGGRRVRALQSLRKLREVVADADAPHVVSASPASHLELRAPRELRAVGEAVGLDPGTVEAGLAEWGRLARRNRERGSERVVEPGVRRGRHDPGGGDEG